MKNRFIKILTALCSAMLVLCFFNACGNEEQPPVDDTTPAQTEQKDEPQSMKAELIKKYPNGTLDVEPENFAKFVTFDLAPDLRQGAVDKMTEQSSLEWKCTKTFTVSKPTTNGWAFSNTYTKGKTYRGLIYAQTMAVSDYFSLLIDQQGGEGFTSETGDWLKVPGVECVQSILGAIQTFMKVSGDSSLYYCAGDSFAGKQLGDFTFTKGQLTSEITKANGQAKMSECYALLQKGDVIQTKNANNHSRMVKEVKVVRNKTDETKIEASRSYVICIEQTDQFDATRNDGVLTNWYIDHRYTFTDLFNDGYLPVTFEPYETNTAPIPYIALDEAPNALEKGQLNGNISSNYYIRYYDVRLTDKDGKVVGETYNTDILYKKETVGLRAFSLKLFGNAVAGNEYTLVVKAGTTHGTAELINQTFTYQGR